MLRLRLTVPCRWRVATLLAALAFAFAPQPARARQVILASDNVNVGAYNAVTGTTINAAFIGPTQGLGDPLGLALDSAHRLFVANFNTDTGGVYNANTGATINATFISGISQPFAVAVDGNNHVFVSSGSTVSRYDATTGALLNGGYISDPSASTIHFLKVDGNNHLFTSNNNR